MVITLTNLPAEIEAALQRKAAQEGKTLDRVALDAVARGLEVNPLPEKKRDLSFFLQGPPLEPDVLQALEDQRKIDPELWQ